MNASPYAFAPQQSGLTWTRLFAQDVEEDLEFDDDLEDDDLSHHKPPSRKPLLWIVLLVVAVGAAYWALTPDLTNLPNLTNTSHDDDLHATPAPDAHSATHESTSSPAVPVPLFGEGQTVHFTPEQHGDASSTALHADPAGKKHGPVLQPGAQLTILDGEVVEHHWVYRVRTRTGKQGWAPEAALHQ